MILVDHIKFVINERISLVKLSSTENQYDEGYLGALDFVLNLIETEEEEVAL